MNTCKTIHPDDWEVGMYVTAISPLTREIDTANGFVLTKTDLSYSDEVYQVVGICIPILALQTVTGPGIGHVSTTSIRNNRVWGKVDKSFVDQYEKARESRP